MPNPPRLDLVHKAICLGFRGHIEWKPQAHDLVRANPEMDRLTPEGIKDLLNSFCRNGGKLDVRPEKRPEYIEEDPDNPYWYRALIPITAENGTQKELFIEVILLDDDEEQPWVLIVSSHF